VGLAGAGFASAAGLTIYVALGMAAGLAVWVCVLGWRKEWGKAFPVVAAGIVAAVLAALYGVELARNSSGVPFAFWGLRQGAPLVRLLYPEATGWVAFLSEVPATLLLELGFLAWAWRVWQRYRSAGVDRGLFQCLILAGFGVTLVARSDSVALNDFCYRTTLPAQFILGLLAVQVAERMNSRRVWPMALLVLGVMGSLGDLALLRIAGPVRDSGIAIWNWPFSTPDKPHGEPGAGELTLAVRNAYEFVSGRGSGAKVVQHNPDVHSDHFAGLYNRCKMRVGGTYLLGVRPAQRALVRQELALWDEVFTGGRPGTTPWGDEGVMALFKPADFKLQENGSWYERSTPIWESNGVRLYSLGRLREPTIGGLARGQ
jgi:hypothetical protein